MWIESSPFTFALGSALAAAGGILVGMLYNRIDPYMGVLPGLKAFVAAVLGGIGIIPGAVFRRISYGSSRKFGCCLWFINLS